MLKTVSRDGTRATLASFRGDNENMGGVPFGRDRLKLRVDRVGSDLAEETLLRAGESREASEF